MFRATLLGALLAGGLVCADAADVIVSVRPPHVLVEKRGVAPGSEYVWVNGYHNWNGTEYVWVPGRWDRPPHPHARWESHRWVHRNGGWVLVEGHWR
jgi:hypothetical protein